MGMFDYFEPKPPLRCECGEPLKGWQGKDGPCELLTWCQGVPSDIYKPCLPDEFEIYTNCEECCAWVTATGFCNDRKVWVTLQVRRST